MDAAYQEIGADHAPPRYTALVRNRDVVARDSTGGRRATPLLRVRHDAYELRREAEYWTVRFEGAVARVKDTKGMRYLAQLFATPGHSWHAVELVVAVHGGIADARIAAVACDDLASNRLTRGRPTVAEAILDAEAKRAYKRRLADLACERDEAEACNDPGRRERAARESETLEHELARALGLRDRDRRAASDAERARLNVTRAIRSAVARLAAWTPDLGTHLGRTLRTGMFCSYDPDPRAGINWKC